MKTFGDWVRHFIDTGIANEQNAISLVQAAQLRGEIEVVSEMPSAQDPNFYYRDENGLFHVLEHLQFGIPIYRKAQDGSFYLVYGEVAEHPSSQKPANSLIDWDDEDSLFANTPEKIKAKLEWMNNHWSGDPFAFGGRHPSDFIILSPYDIWNHEDEIDDGNFDQFGELARKYAGTKRRGVSDEGGMDQAILHQIRGAHLAVRYAQQLCEGEYDPACFADPALDEYFTTAYGRPVLLLTSQYTKGRELGLSTLMVLSQYGGLNSIKDFSAIEELAFKVNIHEHSTITDPIMLQYLYDLVLYNILGTTSGRPDLPVDMPIRQFGFDELNAFFATPGMIQSPSLEGKSLIERWVAEAMGGLTSANWRVWKPFADKPDAYGVRDEEFFNLLLSPLKLDGKIASWANYPKVDFDLYRDHATVEYMEELRSGTKEYTLSDGRKIRFDPRAVRTFSNTEFLQVDPARVDTAREVQTYYAGKDIVGGGNQRVAFNFTDEEGKQHTYSVSLYSHRFEGVEEFDIYVMTPWQQNFAREVRHVDFSIEADADMLRAMCESCVIDFTDPDDGLTKCDYCHKLGLQCHADFEDKCEDD